MLAILTFGVSPLLKKVLGEIIRVLILGSRVQTVKGQFDFRMARVPVALTFIRPKRLANEGDVLEDWLKKTVILVIVAMGQRCFNEMASVVAYE